MGASSLPSGAETRHDPVLGQIRQFAALHGLAVAKPGAPLTPIWADLRAAGFAHPGLAYAAWADSLSLGGVLTSILTNNPTIGSMLEDLERFHPMLGRDRIVLSRHADSLAVTLRTPDDGAADPDTVDATFGMLARATTRLAGRPPQYVRLRRAAPEDRTAYRETLGEVSFGQPADRCVFDKSTLDTVVTNADPAVLELVRPYAHQRLAHTGMRWTEAVSRALMADPHGIPRLADVADALAVSRRTLQMRLSAEGQRFAELAEAVQRDRAVALLAQRDIPITTVAMRSGFATAAAFTRAFRRWTATTPSIYRRTL